ncbi:MAG: TolC family protein [Cytophagales bacterium]|nr:TolC family protein [Cytophagales bacterium]
MKSNIKTIILFWLALWGSLTAQAQQRLKLDSILTVIQHNNPMLQEYRYKAQALNEISKGAKSWMAPMVGLGTFMTPYPGQMVMDERDKGSVMLSAEQSIPNPAKLRANQQLLSSKAAIEEAAGSYTFNELRSQAKTAFYEWLVLEKKLAILRENQEIIQLMFNIAKARYPYNQSPLGNSFKAEGRLHEVENMIFMTENEIIQKNIALNALMNLPKEYRFVIDTTFQEFDAVQLVLDTAELASRRSDIRQINNTIQSMKYAVKLESYQAKPDFRIRYNHMAPLGQMMPSAYTIEGMVSIPIAPWSSKMYKANVRGMNLQIEAMKRGREAILNEAQGMAAGMAWEIQTTRKQLDNYEQKIIPALERNYETVMLAYEENREELPFVIDAYEALIMAQTQYLDVMRRYYQMIVSYEKQLEK